MLLVLLKNVVQPALVLCGLRWLGYGHPLLREAVLMMTIPAMPIVAMLALQYRVAEALAASSVFFQRDRLGDHAGSLHPADKLV